MIGIRSEFFINSIVNGLSLDKSKNCANNRDLSPFHRIIDLPVHVLDFLGFSHHTNRCLQVPVNVFTSDVFDALFFIDFRAAINQKSVLKKHPAQENFFIFNTWSIACRNKKKCINNALKPIDYLTFRNHFFLSVYKRTFGIYFYGPQYWDARAEN